MNYLKFSRHSILSLGSVALLLLLSGCVTHTWAPGPGMSLSDSEPAKARCSLIARHGGSDFVAYGNRSYVAGAALGHAIGESVYLQQDFNDCLQVGSWQIADQSPQAVAAQEEALGRFAHTDPGEVEKPRVRNKRHIKAITLVVADTPRTKPPPPE